MAQQLLDLGTVADDGTGTEGRPGGDIINDNFTELYGFVPSNALLADGSVDSTGDQLFTGHVAFGSTAAVSATSVSEFNETMTAVNFAFHYGINLNFTVDGTPGVNEDVFGCDVEAINQQVPSVATLGILLGAQFRATHDSASDFNRVTGLQMTVRSLSGSGNITQAQGLRINKTWAGGVPTTVQGVRINNMSQSGITDAFGIQVQNQSGGTNNYGIGLNGDGVGSDLAMGAGQDVSLRYGGANTELVNLVGTGNFDIDMDVDLSTYDLITDGTTGTKIGTATTQKLGFWNVTPVIQPAAANQAAITNSSGGTGDGTLQAISGSGDDATINDNFTDVHELLDEIRTALVNTGIIKGAA